MGQCSVILMGLTFSFVIMQIKKEIQEPTSIVLILIGSMLKVTSNHGKEFREVKMDTPF